MEKHFEGCIELIFGPMFSGKSTELQRKVKRFNFAHKRCIVLNWANDNRYSNEEFASTHDRKFIQSRVHCKAKKAMRISEIIENGLYRNYEVIAIDEGQFFPDLVESSDFLANEGKIVIVAALDATFERKGFGSVLELVAMAEKITKLTSICTTCRSREASFTKRLTADKEVEMVGGAEMYKPVCRKCFFKPELHSAKSGLSEDGSSDTSDGETKAPLDVKVKEFISSPPSAIKTL